MNIDLTDFRVLIIDDFYEFRRSMRNMVEQLGASEVDLAASAEEAFELCESHRYNIVLCDYNLGDGKDGQDLHEELIHMNRVSISTTFVMITAEDSKAMVLASLQCEPDTYLTKPFGLAVLENRLAKVLEKKEAMADVYSAIEAGKMDLAIECCTLVMKTSKKWLRVARRLLAELYIKSGQIDLAKAIFEDVIRDRPLMWALMGMGKALCDANEFDEALHFFEDAIHLNNMHLPAYDWLADAQDKVGEAKEAQITLETAVKHSPKAVTRQERLATIAHGNGDLAAETKAYRSAVRHGKHSRHRSPEHHLNLVKCLNRTITGKGGLKETRLAEEAKNSLETLGKQYKDDPEMTMRAKLAAANLAGIEGYEGKSQRLRQDALNAAREMKDFKKPDTYLELAESLEQAGKPDEAQEVLHKMLNKFQDQYEIRDKLKDLLHDQEAVLLKERAAELNATGVKYYKGKNMRDACMAFGQALRLSPENPSYNLNCAQAYLDWFELEKDADMLNAAVEFVSALEDMDQEDYRYGRYQKMLGIVTEHRNEMGLT